MVREVPSRRSAALTTILFDRFLGLYALALLACIVVLTTRAPTPGLLDPLVRYLPAALALVTLVVFVALIALGGDNRVSRAVRRFPWASARTHDLLLTVNTYRSKKLFCILALALSLTVHFLSATAHYVLAQSLLEAPSPTFREHLVMTPLANAAAGLPLTPGGLGTYEAALTYLFDHYPASEAGNGRGFAVALGYRVQTLLIAGIGMIWSIASGRRNSPTRYCMPPDRSIV